MPELYITIQHDVNRSQHTFYRHLMNDKGGTSQLKTEQIELKPPWNKIAGCQSCEYDVDLPSGKSMLSVWHTDM